MKVKDLFIFRIQDSDMGSIHKIFQWTRPIEFRIGMSQ